MAESKPKPRIENPWLRALVDITGGTAGGVGLVLVGHPFDTLKVRLQTQSQTNPMYGGLGDCVAKTWKNEGFGGFYRGWQSPLYGQMIFNAVQFCAYGLAKDFVTKFGSSNNNNNNKNSKEDKTPMTMGQILGAAAMTGFTIAFVEGPIDLFKTQLQTQIFKEKPLYSTFGGCVSHIIKNYGWRGAFQGITPTIARNVPAVTAYFGFYEYAKESFAKQQNTTVDNLPPLSVLTAGATGGFGYWIATYPIDVIKSTMQMDNPDKSQRKYTSIAKTASILYKEGGVKRFFVGISPCLMRAAPANAVCFFFYEATVASFNKQFGK